MNAPAVTGLILAAGESSRMGRLKQLLPWGGATLVEWQVAQMLEAGVDDVVVVVGHSAEAVAEAVQRTSARAAINDAYKEGRASSVRCGAAAIPDGAEAIVILSVDQPRPAWLTRRLIEAWRSQPAPIVMPTFDGRRGHPILVAGSLLEELRSVTEAGLGLRAVTQSHATETAFVAIDRAAVNIDLNTPADYEAALAAYNRGVWGESQQK
jgi:molybdenum cofactor cytidylyltransferase